MKKDTRHLGDAGKPVPPSQAPRHTAPLDVSLPWVIEFRVVGTASTIQSQLRDTMVLGREDPDHGVYPEVDLSPFQAYTLGVSRRHAMIVVQDGRVSVKDLNSTNGTRLNEYQLVGGELYRLRHGDEITLGQLRMQVMFMVVPTHDTQTGRQPSSVPTGAAPSSGEGKRILIVEDDTEVGSVFRMALERAGYQPTLVRTAMAAVDHFAVHAPDAVVMELLLPDLNGLDLVRYLRKAAGTRRVPLLVVSGATGGFQMNKAIEAGADVFLGKPVSIEDLIKALGVALTSS